MGVLYRRHVFDVGPSTSNRVHACFNERNVPVNSEHLHINPYSAQLCNVALVWLRYQHTFKSDKWDDVVVEH